MHILFISNNNLAQPILQSQGIPQILKNSKFEINFSLITFETYEDYNSDQFYKLSKMLTENGVNYIPVKLPKHLFPSGRILVWLLGILKTLNLCIKNRPDIIHTRSYTPTLIAMIAKFVFRVKVVFDMRGIFIEEMIEDNKINRGSIVHKFEKFCEKIYFKYSDKIISVSQKHLEFTNNFYKDIDISDKNIVINNCVNLERFNYKPDKSISNNSVKFIYVGNATTRYDVNSIFKLFEISNDYFSNPKLNIITYLNPSPFYKKLKTIDTKFQENIKIYSLKPEFINQELNQSDIGLVTLNPLLSNYVCAPIKFGEYLAAGLPIIVNEDIGDTEKIVKKYNVGVILRDNNYKKAIEDIKKLLEDSEIGKRCRFAAEKEFNLYDAAKKYRDIYLELNKN